MGTAEMYTATLMPNISDAIVVQDDDYSHEQHKRNHLISLP